MGLAGVSTAYRNLAAENCRTETAVKELFELAAIVEPFCRNPPVRRVQLSDVPMILVRPKGAILLAVAAAHSLAVCLASPALAGERRDPGVLVRHSEVKPIPSIESETVGTLEMGSRVVVAELRGPWIHVYMPVESDGWVQMRNVRLGAEESGRTALVKTWLRQVTGAVVRAESSTNRPSVGAHQGIRGLTPQDVTDATPNDAERKKLDEFRVSAKQAESHARNIKLTSRNIDYLNSNESSSESSGESFRGKD